jgi:hypothetical protein
MARRIRVSVEVNYAGIDIPDDYEDLPEDWDEMSAKDRDDYLRDLAVDALSLVAGSGACVVDENDEVVE